MGILLLVALGLAFASSSSSAEPDLDDGTWSAAHERAYQRMLASGAVGMSQARAKARGEWLRKTGVYDDAEAIRAEVDRIARESREIIIDGTRDEYTADPDDESEWTP